MGSKSARLRKRHELMARRRAAEARQARLEAEEARKAALKAKADGEGSEGANGASASDASKHDGQPDGQNVDEVVKAGADTVEINESSRLFKRKVRARKLAKTAGSLRESAETLKKTAPKSKDAEPDPVPAAKGKSGKIATKVVAVIAAAATLGSVVIAALYSGYTV